MGAQTEMEPVNLTLLESSGEDMAIFFLCSSSNSESQDYHSVFMYTLVEHSNIFDPAFRLLGQLWACNCALTPGKLAA